MGEDSWVMLATRDAMQKSFGSACHGAGRTMSRHEANHHAEPVAIDEELEGQGVHVRSSGDGPTTASGGVKIKENIDAVVETVAGARLAGKVARLRPLAVVHG
jgi:tRNA-splicing ligase RtcB